MSQQVVFEYLVVGIAPSGDPEQLEDQMSSETIDHDRLTVVTKDRPTPEHEESPLRFVHVHVGLPHETTDVDHETILGDESILTDAGGVNIPNISADTRHVDFFTHPAVVDHLAGFPIPADEIENYNEAIEAGRCVLLYRAQAQEAQPAQQAFKDAGLKNVKAYQAK
jgi:hypothetical protein